MRIYDNGIYRDLTQEELNKLNELENHKYDGWSFANVVVSLVREKYTIDDELAIQRQREEKPEEFKEYFDFVENCKLQARLLIDKGE